MDIPGLRYKNVRRGPRGVGRQELPNLQRVQWLLGLGFTSLSGRPGQSGLPGGNRMIDAIVGKASNRGGLFFWAGPSLILKRGVVGLAPDRGEETCRSELACSKHWAIIIDAAPLSK